MSRILIPEGKRLISGAESCSLKAYNGHADPPHVWTIGWGHVIGPTEKYLMAGITQEKADAIFQNDLASHVAFIQSDIGAKIVLDDYVWAACASLAYNNGAHVFAGAPSITGQMRAGHLKQGILNFYKFCKSGDPLIYRDGLFYRRLQETVLALDHKLIPRPHECGAVHELIGHLSTHGFVGDMSVYFAKNHVKGKCVTCSKRR